MQNDNVQISPSIVKAVDYTELSKYLATANVPIAVNGLKYEFETSLELIEDTTRVENLFTFSLSTSIANSSMIEIETIIASEYSSLEGYFFFLIG